MRRHPAHHPRRSPERNCLPPGEPWQVAEPGQAALNRLKRLGIPPLLALDLASSPRHTPLGALPTTADTGTRFPAAVTRAFRVAIADEICLRPPPKSGSELPPIAKHLSSGKERRKPHANCLNTQLAPHRNRASSDQHAPSPAHRPVPRETTERAPRSGQRSTPRTREPSRHVFPPASRYPRLARADAHGALSATTPLPLASPSGNRLLSLLPPRRALGGDVRVRILLNSHAALWTCASLPVGVVRCGGHRMTADEDIVEAFRLSLVLLHDHSIDLRDRELQRLLLRLALRTSHQLPPHHRGRPRRQKNGPHRIIESQKTGWRRQLRNGDVTLTIDKVAPFQLFPPNHGRRKPYRPPRLAQGNPLQLVAFASAIPFCARHRVVPDRRGTHPAGGTCAALWRRMRYPMVRSRPQR